ncbi:MAG: hypothetical protein EOO16_05530 [Chitinophagaceae bacterium]|nr:MAG: hypothetical protein EOO16_05530 [Chitinophagaceae bacterium]
MNRIVLLAAFGATLFASCKKSTDDSTDPAPVTPVRTGPNVTQQNLSAGLSSGTTLRFNGVNSTGGGAITIPQAGTGQTWNYSAATISFQDSMVLGAAGSSAFPTANFTRTINLNFGTGAGVQSIPQRHYYEVNANGWSELGYDMQAFMLSYQSLGTITYPQQSDAYTPTRLPMTPALPMYVGDSVNYSTVVTENSIANAPTYFVNNAPAAQKYTYNGKAKVIGSGNLSLPGFATALPALLVRRDQSVTLNFLLNGGPVPAQLLTQLGIQDGQTTTTTFYDFYHQGNLGYLGFVAVESGAVTYAYLRKP